MRTRTKVAAGVAFAVVALAVGRFVAHDWLTVDSCYDSGGVYLDEIDKCSHSQVEVDLYRPK
ncbi:hypothetical protein [Brevundimonas sp.]|uniref:hypothetical protein n=1 Tax=Brevundimonas sp. TaxID=1871086 RepID=UPI0035B01887